MASNRSGKCLWPCLALIAVATLSVSRVSADNAADPKSDAARAGIFIEDPQTKAETKLEATMMADYGAKGVAASMLTAGLAKPKIVWTFGGARAEQRLPAQAAFRFRFDPNANTPSDDPAAIMAMVMGGGPGLPPSAKSPKDFVLLVLDVREEAREFTTTASSGRNKPQNTAVAVVVEKVAPNDFRVRTKQPLAAGEYGFYCPGTDGQGRIWAFGVD